MNIQKSIQTGLLINGYKTKKQFCEDKGISPGLLSRISKGCLGQEGTNYGSTLLSLKSIADGFGVPVSKFIEWGEW